MTTEPDEEPTQMQLVLAFDTDEPEFTRGFECGQLWEQLDGGYQLEKTIHTTNVEMAMRIAEARGYDFAATGDDPNWVHVHFTRKVAL